jgi:hypothetical protein
MAKTPTTTTIDDVVTEPKVRKTRSPSAPRAVYAVIQVLDADGNPQKLDKASVRVLSFERSAEAVLAKIESGEHPNALYLRGIVPAGR